MAGIADSGDIGEGEDAGAVGCASWQDELDIQMIICTVLGRKMMYAGEII